MELSYVGRDSHYVRLAATKLADCSGSIASLIKIAATLIRDPPIAVSVFKFLDETLPLHFLQMPLHGPFRECDKHFLLHVVVEGSRWQSEAVAREELKDDLAPVLFCHRIVIHVQCPYLRRIPSNVTIYRQSAEYELYCPKLRTIFMVGGHYEESISDLTQVDSAPTEMAPTVPQARSTPRGVVPRGST